MTPQEELNACIMHPELMKAWYGLRLDEKAFFHAELDLEKLTIEIWIQDRNGKFNFNDEWDALTDAEKRRDPIQHAIFSIVNEKLLVTYTSNSGFIKWPNLWWHIDDTNRTLDAYSNHGYKFVWRKYEDEELWYKSRKETK